MFAFGGLICALSYGFVCDGCFRVSGLVFWFGFCRWCFGFGFVVCCLVVGFWLWVGCCVGVY